MKCLALLPAAVATAWLALLASASTLRGPVFDPRRQDDLPTERVQNATVDREFVYPEDFQLDRPFTVSLGTHESVLVPLAPIRSKLFGAGEDARPAIGLELNACAGAVLTTLVMESGEAHRVSAAAYQCATLTKTPDVDLCPLVHGGRDLAIHKDPTQAKGFVLRAFESVEVVLLLRSARDRGAYNKAFFVDGDPVQAAASRQLNVSFSATATQLSFLTARTWQPASTNASCDGCEYTLFAEMVPSLNGSDEIPQHPPPPYCVSRRGSISYKLPSVSSSDVAHLVTLPTGFGELFSTSGDYNFVLMASMAASMNNDHPALFSYAPVRVKVAAPTHLTSHVLVILAVIAVVVVLSVLATRAKLPQRMFGSPSSADEPVHDDESVRLLAQVIAEQDAHDATNEDPDNADEERKSESLLDVIRKTKAKETTPRPSPRQPSGAGAQLEGYHEIN